VYIWLWTHCERCRKAPRTHWRPVGRSRRFLPTWTSDWGCS